jgi:YidC/Oxa1 family membrane protein insertase
MDFLFQPMIAALTFLEGILGSYGWAIIAFTVIIRLILWPLNTQQTKSMKAMQTLQPKLKEIQDKHKDNPQAMQAEIMEFYKNNKFNPLAGCLPMILQIPIFIALYGSLSSPDFLQLAGNESFGFIKHLHSTWNTVGGTPLDGTMAVTNTHKTFDAGKNIKVYLKGVEQPAVFKIKDLRMNDAKKLLNVSPQPPIPTEPLTFAVTQSDLGFSDDYMEKVERVEASAVNLATKEIENISLVPGDDPNKLTQSIPTTQSERVYHFDVLALIVIYGLMSWAYQWSMSKVTGNAMPQEGPQALMGKFMPILFAGLMLIIQIPAGVMLYLVTTMVMMLIQNLWLAKDDKPNSTTAPMAKTQVVDIK